MKIGDLVKAIPNDPIGKPYIGIVVNKTFKGQSEDIAINWLQLNPALGYFHADEWKFEVLSEVKK